MVLFSEVLKNRTADDDSRSMLFSEAVKIRRLKDFDEEGIINIPDEKKREFELKGEIGFVEQLRRQDKTEMLPFNPESAFKAIALKRTFDRLEKNQYENFPPQKQLDLDFVNNFIEKSVEERTRGFTIGGKVAQNVTALPAFMIEFLATGGLATGAKTLVKTGAKRVIKELSEKGLGKFITQVAGVSAGAVARTAVQPQKIVAGFGERQVEAGLEFTEQGVKIAEESSETPWTSFWKATGDQVIENLSEVSGPFLGRVAGRVIPKKAVTAVGAGIATGAKRVLPQRMASAISKMYKKLNPNKSVEKLFTKAGYNGFLPEIGEERFGATLRAITGVENFGAKDPDNVFDRLVASIPSGEDMLVEGLVLAFPGGAKAAVSSTISELNRRRGVKAVREAAKKEADEFIELDDQAIDEILAIPKEGEQERAIEGVEQPTTIDVTPEGAEPVVLVEPTPDFQNTEEALAFGAQATPEQEDQLRIDLEEANQEFDSRAEAVVQEFPEGEAPIERLQEISDLATKAQLRREALEAVGLQQAEIPKLSEEEISKQIESVKDKQVKGRLNKLDSEIKDIDKQIDDLQKQSDSIFSKRESELNSEIKNLESIRDRLQKQNKPTKSIENRIEKLSNERDNLIQSREVADLDSKSLELLEKRDILDSQRAELLIGRRGDIDVSKEDIQIKGKQLASVVLQGIKKQVRALSRGFREGQSETRKQVKSIQEALISILNKSGLEAKDKSKFISLVKNANTVKKFNNAVREIENRSRRLLESSEKDRLSKDIKKELDRTKPVKRGQRRVGKFNYQENKFFEDLRNFNTMTKDQAQAELEMLPDISTSEMDLVKKRFLSLKANGKEASLAIHEKVLKDLIRMRNIAEESKSLTDFQNKVDRAERVDQALDGVNKVKADKKTIKTKIGNFYRLGFSNIFSMLNSIFGRKIADLYNPELAENRRNTAVSLRVKKMTSEMEKIYKKGDPFGILEELSMEEYDITDFEGLTTKINKLQLIDIYNSIKNDAIRKRYFDAFGEDQITNLLGNLLEQDIEFADYLQEEVQSYRNILNDRKIEISGLDLGFVENYWPATSEFQPDIFDDIRVQGETPSALKERAKGKVIPIPKDAWIKAQRHVSQGEHVENLSREHETLKRIFTNRKIKNAVESKFGKEVYDTLLTQIDEISLNKQTKKVDFFTKWIGAAVNNWVVAKVGIPNINIPIKQLISMGNFAEDMDSAEWARVFKEGVFKPEETFKFMWNNFPFLEARFNRGFSEALATALAGADKVGRNWSKWQRFITSWGRAGDITAIIYGGFPLVQAEIAKAKAEGKSQEEAIKQAGDVFEQATIRAQQSALSSSRSQFQNSGNPFTRFFLAFKNTVTQYLRKMADATISFQNGDISLEQYTKVMTIYAVIQPILYSSAGVLTRRGFIEAGKLLTGRGGDDDEPLVEELLVAAFTQIAISPVAAVPFVESSAKFAMRKATNQKVFKFLSTPLLDDLDRGLSRFGKKDITAEDYLLIGATLLEPTTAFPGLTLFRDYKYLNPKPRKRVGF